MPDNLNFTWGNTFNLARAGAIAGTGGSFTSTAATVASIGGKFAASMAPQTNVALPTLDYGTGLIFNALAPNQVCALVFGVNAAGTLQVCQGRAIATGPGGAIINDPQFPGQANDFCPIAYTIVTTGTTSASWTPGTSSWTATGVNATVFTNVAQLPNRPQAS